jgi:hypothetical protein
VALVLETLGGNQSLDLGSLGVRRLALTLGLYLSSNDVLADLFSPIILVSEILLSLGPFTSPLPKEIEHM